MSLSIDPAPRPGRPMRKDLETSLKQLPDQTIHVEQLDNGVSIVTHSRPKSGSVDVTFGLSAGGHQDPKGKQGLAHLIEHMAFEGTPSRTHSEIFHAMSAQGGLGNATTTLADTEFTTTVAVRDAKSAISRMTDQILNPNTGRYQVEREKRIVQQEMRYNYGNRTRIVNHENLLLNYGLKPDTRMNIGTNETVGSITPGDVKKFISENYTGANLIVSLDGDPRGFNLPLIRKELGKLPPGKAQATNPPETLKARKGALLEMIPDPTDINAVVTVSAPNMGEKDHGLAAVLASSVLGDKANQRIRERERLSYGAFADSDGIVTSVETKLQPAKFTEGMEQIVRSIKTLPQTITEADVTRAKRELTAQLLLKSQDSGAYATSLYNALLAGGGGVPMTPEMRIRRIQKITTKQVIEAAKTGLDLKNIKILVTGTLPTQKQVQDGIKAAGVDVKLTRVPFQDSKYQKMYNVPDAKIS